MSYSCISTGFRREREREREREMVGGGRLRTLCSGIKLCCKNNRCSTLMGNDKPLMMLPTERQIEI